MNVTKKQLRAWAWEQAPASGVRSSALLLLQALVGRFNAKAGAASPSVREIARLTNQSSATVTAGTKVLVRAGLVRVEHQFSPNGAIRPSRYTFAPQWAPSTPALVTVAPVEAPTVERDPDAVGLDEGHVLVRTTRFGSRSGTVDANGRIVPPGASPAAIGRDSTEHRAVGVTS